MAVPDLSCVREDFFSLLYALLHERKQDASTASYVADLYQSGLDRILQKVGEEAVETVLAAKNGVEDEIIHEMADLWFHTLVLLAHKNIHPDRVVDELKRRHEMQRK